MPLLQQHRRPMKRFANTKRRMAPAFTLIELLVVIGVIAILAGLILGALPAVTGKRVRARVTAERAAIESAIESYKQKKGFYPPGTNALRPTLYYELTGQPIDDSDLKAFFGVTQTVNSGAEDSYNFYKNLRPSQLVTNVVNNKPAVMFAIHTTAGDGSPIAVWHYDSMSDTRHNHESFDLWVDVKVNGKSVTMGNWGD
jgi:prepilin-type N-terminal cleavage/methylation domain-containing protein